MMSTSSWRLPRRCWSHDRGCSGRAGRRTNACGLGRGPRRTAAGRGRRVLAAHEHDERANYYARLVHSVGFDEALSACELTGQVLQHPVRAAACLGLISHPVRGVALALAPTWLQSPDALIATAESVLSP